MRLILLTALTMLAFAANSILNRAALAGGEAGPASFRGAQVGLGRCRAVSAGGLA